MANDGVPAAPITVTRFSFQPPKFLPAPRALRIQRGAKKVRVVWKPVPGATYYQVALRGTSGLTRLKSVKRTSAVLGAPKSEAGRVVVRAVRGPGDVGRVAKGRFRARAKVQSDFRPFRELRRL